MLSRKWFDVVLWPRNSDYWASLTQKRLIAKISKIEETLKQAEALNPADTPYELKIQYRIEWKITSEVFDMISGRLYDNMCLYALGLLLLANFWIPLEKFSKYIVWLWVVVFIVALQYLSSVIQLILVSVRHARDRSIYTSYGKKQLIERLNILKARLK